MILKIILGLIIYTFGFALCKLIIFQKSLNKEKINNLELKIKNSINDLDKNIDQNWIEFHTKNSKDNNLFANFLSVFWPIVLGGFFLIHLLFIQPYKLVYKIFEFMKNKLSLILAKKDIKNKLPIDNSNNSAYR